MLRPFPSALRTAYDLTAISFLVGRHVVRVSTRIIIAIPADMTHGKCLKNAGPACDHDDCPHLECHPGVHKLEERYGASQLATA